MVEPIIKAGEVWRGPNGEACEWLEDMRAGDLITENCVLIDGRHPKAHSKIPSWIFERMLLTGKAHGLLGFHDNLA